MLAKRTEPFNKTAGNELGKATWKNHLAVPTEAHPTHPKVYEFQNFVHRKSQCSQKMCRCWSSQCYSYCYRGELIVYWVAGIYPTFLAVAEIKFSGQRNLRQKGIYYVSQIQVTNHHSQGSQQQDLQGAGHIVPTVKERDGCMLATQFLSPFMQSRTPSQGMTVPIFKVDLPLSVNAIKTTHHRNSSMSLL